MDHPVHFTTEVELCLKELPYIYIVIMLKKGNKMLRLAGSMFGYEGDDTPVPNDMEQLS